MRMTSSRVPTSAAMFLALLLAAPLAFADKNDDTYAKGQKAVNDGDSVAASNAFCSLPADFKDAGAQCAQYKPLAEKKLNLYKLNYSNGMQALQSGDYATAETEFKKVKYGEYAEQAKQRLVEIPGLKQKAADAANAANANAALEGQMKSKLDAGTNAWNSGDFNSAKADLGTVTGSHQSEAQAILGKIRNYENAMQQGNGFMAAKDYNAAKNSFADAMRINPSGPGNPADMMAKAAVAASAPVPNTNPAANTTATAKPPQPKPQVDVNAYLESARKLIAKNQFAKARTYVEEVLRQERGNREATDLLTQINANDTTVAQAGGADKTLSGIIQSFYQDTSVNNFSDTEDQLKFYLFSKGKSGKAGLANFYLGASMLSRFYLSGGIDQNLKRDALSKFKAAKAIDGFNAPDKFVSPKIMKAFQEAS